MGRVLWPRRAAACPGRFYRRVLRAALGDGSILTWLAGGHLPQLEQMSSPAACISPCRRLSY